MKSTLVTQGIALSSLVPSRTNPRRVKPSREAHQRLVAHIRAHGLLHPLLVRPDNDGRYVVVAGNRRLAALRDIHRQDGDPKVPCLLRDVDLPTAESLSLGENFAREPMHPLDEAVAFARLARHEGKQAEAIAAEFGVTEHYVRQRMKLAGLAEPVKAAYREGAIDTATAEAFAAVPEDRQREVWQEVQGHPRHAEHVRNVIAHQWIDAKHALFDVSTLPERAVSADLFGDRVLVERAAFLEAQGKALEAQRQALLEEGWKEVVVGRREDVQDRLYAMEEPEQEFDEATGRTLARIDERLAKLQTAAESLEGVDERRLERLNARFVTLEDERSRVVEEAPPYASEATKAAATAFLILDPDGRTYREYRVPRQRQRSLEAGPYSTSGDDPVKAPAPPTPDELSDRQLGVTFTHQALAVREALLQKDRVRRIVLAMILHESVRSEALAVRHEANGTTLHADAEGFASPSRDRLKAMRQKLDPLFGQSFVEDLVAYQALASLSDAKLGKLIDLLTVECVAAHLVRRTELVQHLSAELTVSVREHWRPDADWLGGFRKIQLAQLITELKGAVHAPAPERKKSELVEVLATLFAEAAEGKLEDAEIAQRVNAWLPSNLRRMVDAAMSNADMETS